MAYLRNIFLLLMVTLVACTQDSAADEGSVAMTVSNNYESDKNLSRAYFASGCFWCVEAVFESVEGVKEAISGYSGGKIKNPTYRLISSGSTRHAETVEVIYDPKVVSYETLLTVFFDSHDPTTPDQQGPDRGPQYRSAIFYQNNDEKKAAEAYIKKLQPTLSAKIVTEVSKFDIFYKAEAYHQDYERKHPNNSYIRAVSIPRLKRFQKKHPELLKKSAAH